MGKMYQSVSRFFRRLPLHFSSGVHRFQVSEMRVFQALGIADDQFGDPGIAPLNLRELFPTVLQTAVKATYLEY
jgi:hypothetical protein